jgi:hypothetical protein
LCADVVELRRGDHHAERLRIERERLDRERERTEEEVVEQFERWAQSHQVRDCICQNWISPEERKRALREIYGRAPESADGPGPDQAEPGPEQGEPAT